MPIIQFTLKKDFITHRIANNILSEKEDRRHKFHKFKQYYKVLIKHNGSGIKTYFCSVEEDWNPRDRPSSIRSSIFQIMDTPNQIQWNKENLFSKWSWKNRSATLQKNEPRTFLNILQKVKWIWIKDLISDLNLEDTERKREAELSMTLKLVASLRIKQ